jgi:hypothetical protein
MTQGAAAPDHVKPIHVGQSEVDNEAVVNFFVHEG